MTLPQPRRRTLVDAALWAAVAAAVLCAFRFRLQHAHGIAANYDDGVYWQTGLALADGARAYDQVFHAQPPLFVWLLALPFRWTDDPAVGVQAARLLMAGFAVMLTAIAAGIATTLRGARAGMLAALGVAAVPLIQGFSFQLGADIPAATLGGAALWAALCARTAAPDRRRWLWLATGGLVALAGLTKLIAVVIVPAVLLALLIPWRRSFQAARWSALGFGATTALVLLALQPPQVAWSQIFGFHLDATHEPVVSGLPELVTWAGPWCLPLLLAAAVAAVVGTIRTPTPDRAAVLSVALWAAAVIPLGLWYHPTFVHHLLLFIAPCIVLISVALADLWSGADARWPAATVIVVALACGAVAWQARAMNLGRPARVTAMDACLRSLPDRTTIVGDDQEMLARAGLRTPPWLVDTSLVRLQSGELTDAELIAASRRADGVLLSSFPRLSLRTDYVDWVEQDLPVRYKAAGYTLFVHTPELLSGCGGRQPAAN